MSTTNSADDGARRGAPGSAEPGPQPHDDSELRAYLAGAPESLREWADAQLALLGDAPTSPPEAPSQASEAADLALAELGEEDHDELNRQPKVHTPLDKTVTTVPRTRQRSRLVPLLSVALVAVLVYGIFRIGLPETEQAVPDVPAPSETTSDVARMAELEARLIDTPEDVAANLELGVLAFNAGDLERAKELWTSATDADPRNPQAWYNLGFLHLAEEPMDLDAAQADWQKVLDVAPDSDLAATVKSHIAALEDGAMGGDPSVEEE